MTHTGLSNQGRPYKPFPVAEVLFYLGLILVIVVLSATFVVTLQANSLVIGVGALLAVMVVILGIRGAITNWRAYRNVKVLSGLFNQSTYFNFVIRKHQGAAVKSYQSMLMLNRDSQAIHLGEIEIYLRGDVIEPSNTDMGYTIILAAPFIATLGSEQLYVRTVACIERPETFYQAKYNLYLVLPEQAEHFVIVPVEN